MPLSFTSQRDDATWLARLIAACDAVSARGSHTANLEASRDFEAHFMNPMATGGTQSRCHH